jgi:hypothetical protein
MKKIIATQIASLLLASFCAGVLARDFPKSGSFKIQSISKAGAPVKFNDDYTHNTATGLTFNEKGSGPLHLGKVACSISSLSRKDIERVIGFCNFEDKDGDSIFVQYAGKGNAKGEFNGMNDIVGGTGKFEGISGSGPVACSNTNKKGEFPCAQKFDYQLPE